MRRHFIVLAAAVLVLSLASTGVLAQSRNTGALRGNVTDENKARIPGVVVELSSPDMIGGRKVMTTDASGSYRFPELPPGLYLISFTIDGYKPEKHEGIVINAAKSFDLDIKLTPQAGEETITVEGQTPLVDTTSAGTTTNFNNDYLQNLPTARFQPDTLNLAPGIENSAAYGGGGSAANAYQIDGVDVSDPEGGTPWSFLNYNIMKEVQLIGLGAPAEYGAFTGVLFNSVTKSGGNDFSGLAEYYMFPKSWVPRNTHEFSDDQISRIEKSFDSTLQVGGPFIKDKLWYFVSAQYLNDEQSLGGPIITEKDPRLFAKLSWQVNPNNKLELWAEWDRFDIEGRDGDLGTELAATVTEDAPEYVWNLTWSRIINPKTSFNLAYSGYTGYYYLDPASGYDTPGHLNSAGFATENSTYYYLADRYRHVMVASLSHYSDTFLTGKHDFKYGAELERARTRSRAGIPGDFYYYDLVDYGGNVYYTYAYQGYYTYDQKAISSRITAFAQDKWQITDRLTVEPGIRFDFNRGAVPGRANAYKTNPIAPRLGFSYDLTGKNTTVVKCHFGRYFEGFKSSYYQYLSPKAAADQAVYAFDPTTTTFDRQNPDPALLSSTQPQQRYRMDSDVKHPFVDQYFVAFEHDFGNDFAVKAEFIYRKNHNFIETVSQNGDFTRVVGVDEDTGGRIRLFNQGNLDDTLLITNPSDLKRQYRGAIFTMTKRLTKGWQALVSYAKQFTRGTIDNLDTSTSEVLGTNYGPSPFLDTPNSRFNYRGRLSNDFENEITVQGQYIIPRIEVTVSTDYRYVSGGVYTKVGTASQFLADPNDPGSLTDFNQGRVRYFTERRGTRRLNPTSLLNFRAEKYFAFNGGTKFGVFLDAFNLMNKGEDLAVETRRGSTFGDTRTFMAPRTMRIGVRYDW